MLTESQLAVIRTWIGSGETDEELDAIYEMTGSIDATIEYVLRSRVSELAGQPQSFSVPGLSITHGSDLMAWKDILLYFQSHGGSGLDSGLATSGLNSAKLVRPDLR